MKKAIINKHIDNSLEGNKRDYFVDDLELAKGEILISNDSSNPSIFIVNNDNEVVKISGSGSSGGGGSYDDTDIRSKINELNTEISVLQGNDGKEMSVREIAEDVMKSFTPTSPEELEGITAALEGFDAENTVKKAVDSKYSLPEGGIPQSDLNEEVVSAIDKANSALQSDDLDNYYTKDEIGEGFDSENTVTKAVNTVQSNLNTITSELRDELSAITESVNIINADENTEGSFKKYINDTKNIIDEYKVNGFVISENPVLNTDDLKISNNYSTSNGKIEDITPDDIITKAFSKLEIALAQTSLALTAAINDLEKRIGIPTQYDENNNVIKEGTGLMKRVEQLEKNI